MKKILAVLILVCLFCGCSQGHSNMEKALSFRESLTASNGCTFCVDITADYVDVSYTFTLDCRVDSDGKLTFEVVSPDSIQGISGSISATEGKLTFDDKVLLFSMLADGEITPVSAPWFFINALTKGYIKGCSVSDDGMLLYINDSYSENAMEVNVLIQDNVPTNVEIVWDNRRVIGMAVENFQIV